MAHTASVPYGLTGSLAPKGSSESEFTSTVPGLLGA